MPGKKDEVTESPWPGVWRELGANLLPLIISAGSLIGFVAFAGSVIVWTRFLAIDVPPDQAVAAFPQGELVAIGASLLLLCGFFGALAVLAVLLIDRSGRATLGMSRGLLGLLMFEGVAVIAFVGEHSWPDKVVAAELLILATATVIWCTYYGAFVDYEKGLPDQDGAELEEQPQDRPFRLAIGGSAISGYQVARVSLIAIALGALATFGAWLFGASTAAMGIAGLSALGSTLSFAVTLRWAGFYRAKEPEDSWDGGEDGEEKEEEEGKGSEEVGWWKTLRRRFLPCRTREIVTLALLVAVVAAAVTVLFGGLRDDTWKVTLIALALVLTLGLGCRWILLSRREEVQRARDNRELREAEAWAVRGLWEEYAEEAESWRVEQEKVQKEKKEEGPLPEKPHKPPHISFNYRGKIAVALLMAIAIGVPALILQEAWLIGSLVSATVLAAGLWRISDLAETRFLWYGLAVFLSVPLFGTLTWMARNLADPQVQPVALIRETDGPDEAIQGLYVTEADKRVYFATVGTEGCSGEVTPNSGRLLWVPRSEVVAMSIGPLQSVDDAAKTSLEMSYALTPAVETLSGDSVPPDSAAGAAPEEAPVLSIPKRDQRLEKVGAAIRPGFGAGLSLEPENASPGQVVTLRMDKPNRNGDVDGFGASRSGRILHLGGVRVKISKEKARSAANAEYIQVRGGTALSIDKKTVYTKVAGEYVELDEHPIDGEGRFVKLNDRSVIAVNGGALATGMYLRLDGDDQLMRVSGRDRKQPGLVSSLVAAATAPFKDVLSLVLGDALGAGELHGPRPTVTMRGSGEELPLEYALLRQAWHEDHIRFTVPDNGSTGPVTVECEQLAGQPFLRVSRPPTARIAVRMQAGSRRIGFDSRRSSDDTGIESVRWTIGGLPHGKEPRTSSRLRSRLTPYRVRLTVTDRDHETDTAELHLLRLPASFFPFGKAKPERRHLARRIQGAVVRAAQEEPPARIEVDGFADDVGSATYNADLSMQRAINVGGTILTQAAAAGLGLAERVPVRSRGFGESCPLDAAGGRLRVNRRVEIFLLGEGTSIITPPGCHATRTATDHW